MHLFPWGINAFDPRHRSEHFGMCVVSTSGAGVAKDVSSAGSEVTSRGYSSCENGLP